MEKDLGPLDVAFMEATADIPDTLCDAAAQMPAAVPAGFVQAPPSSSLTVETLDMTFGMIFDLIASSIGPGGEFWRLKEVEKSNLAKVWQPVLAPLFDAWAGSNPGLIVACGMTLVTIGPRVVRTTSLRASMKAGTETAKSMDSSSLQDQPEAENLWKQTDSWRADIAS